MATLSGGDKLTAALKALSAKVSKPGTLNVGFLEGSTESETGQPSAYIASIHEFGGTWTHPAHEQTIYRKVLQDGTFSKNGQFVKKSKSNFATDHQVDEYKFTIPARPFFRPMIAEKAPTWGEELGERLVAANYDVTKALNGMCKLMAGQLVASIDAVTEPLLKPATIKRKGFARPLVDRGDMRRAVAEHGYEVKT